VLPQLREIPGCIPAHRDDLGTGQQTGQELPVGWAPYAARHVVADTRWGAFCVVAANNSPQENAAHMSINHNSRSCSDNCGKRPGAGAPATERQ